MSEPSIFVENITKKYLIGTSNLPYQMLRHQLAQTFSASWQHLKNLLQGKKDYKSNKYEEIWALKGVSFKIHPGEAVAIIGNNGTGKSTLLKILSRITPPTSGKATINGRMGSLLEVGTGFHPELTGRENIYLNGSILGMYRKEIEKKFDEIVDFAQIEKFLDTPVKHYSSGMYMRLAFSVAAHLDTDILIVDEVLAVGDIRFQKKCLGKMEDVAKRGRTVIFVSHNMPAVRSLCTRGILLDQGKIIRDGPINEVVHDYLASYLQVCSAKYWKKEEHPVHMPIKMISVELKKGNEELTESINISEDHYIDMTYEVVNTGTQACLSLSILTEEGASVFNSLNNLEEHYYAKPLKQGIYRTRCVLPKNLFNDGRYYVSILQAAGNWGDSLIHDRAISFEAIDDGILRGDYFGAYPGYVRPMLKWSTNEIDLTTDPINTKQTRL